MFFFDHLRIWKQTKNIKQTKNTKGQKIPKLETKKRSGREGRGQREERERQAGNESRTQAEVGLDRHHHFIVMAARPVGSSHKCWRWLHSSLYLVCVQPPPQTPNPICLEISSYTSLIDTKKPLPELLVTLKQIRGGTDLPWDKKLSNLRKN